MGDYAAQCRQEHGYGMKLGVAAVAILVSVVLLPRSSWSMNFEFEYTDYRPVFPPTLRIEMSGEIESGDTLRLREAMLPFANHIVREVVISIDSPGGNVVESMQLGRYIGNLPYVTKAYVGVEGGEQICASACVNVYLGADYRFLSDLARIGVHQFSFSNPDFEVEEALSISQELSAQLVEYITEMRADPDFFTIMVSEYPRSMEWVPRERLEELRVVTNGIYDETAEYQNVNGSLALLLSQISQFGTNRLTLVCGDRGLVGIADLNEPEMLGYGLLELYVDGNIFPIEDFEVVSREEHRFVVVSLFSTAMLDRLSIARELGARWSIPETGMFFGFEEGVRDQRIAEIASSCLESTQAQRNLMTPISDVDFTGGDITQDGHKGVSFEQCQTICLRDSNCRAISYVVSRSWCWPKSDILERNINADVISAFRN